MKKLTKHRAITKFGKPHKVIATTNEKPIEPKEENIIKALPKVKNTEEMPEKIKPLPKKNNKKTIASTEKALVKEENIIEVIENENKD